MLIQFAVENYMSFRDETILSMEAGAGTEHKEYLQKYRDGYVLPAAAIYGANAAGKSNVFKAMASAIKIIRGSNERQIDQPIPFISPYAFDENSRNKPSKFDFIFVTAGVRYQYGFSADRRQIHEEYLYKYNSKIRSLIFERKNTKEYRYTKANEGKLRQFEIKTSDNKLFLSTATNWNCDLTKDAYMWFSNSIDTYDDTSLDLEAYEKQGEELKPFITTLLANADINVSGYDIKIENVPTAIHIDSVPDNALPPITTKNISIRTNHLIERDGITKEYSLPFNVESNGTKRIFLFGPIIKDALEKGKTIAVDEIDNSFHPLFLEYLISLFNHKETNPNNAQLIFNTQSVEILSLDLFRRDQIYFVEKNNKNGVSELYSLDEFSPRKTENVRKGYLLGRYGAVPNIGWRDLQWEQ